MQYWIVDVCRERSMKETEHEQFHHDSDADVEISDIPEEEVGSPKRVRGRAGIRIRAGQAPPLLLVIVLVLVIIVGSSAIARDTLVSGIFGRVPTPTPTLAPGIDLFYLQGLPAW